MRAAETDDYAALGSPTALDVYNNLNTTILVLWSQPHTVRCTSEKRPDAVTGVVRHELSLLRAVLHYGP